MSDETYVPDERETAGETPPGDAWEDLGRRIAELGGAIVDTVRAAADDPENRRRARELGEELESMARQVSDAISGAAGPEAGQRVKEAADKVAAAGRRAAEEARPHIADAARKAGAALHDAASRIEHRQD